MPEFSKKSKENLLSCRAEIQDVFTEVIKHFDCSVIEGHRDKERQDKMAREKRSKVVYPQSKHNSFPSKACDAVPYPVDWNDKNRFYYFAGFVMGVAKVKGISLRWGGDWDRDFETKDNRFNDLPHFEIDER